MPFLVDLCDVPDSCCSHHLELMAKAMREPEPVDTGIWLPHENPALTFHVEDVTRRFQMLLKALQDAFARLLIGKPLDELKKAAAWERWDESDFARARARLEAKAPVDYTLDDWMLVVDYLVQRYLPAGVIEREADYLTVRAAIMGKIQANMARLGADPPSPDELVELVPTQFAHIPPKVLSPMERAILRIAKARAAENIGHLADDARHAMKGMIIEHVQAQLLGQKEGTARALESRLFDSYGQLNRDFRRIAVTEAGNVVNEGFIAAQEPGARVRRTEAYRGACDFCKSISGKVFTVVSPDKPDKDGETEVWVGKSNIGRSASPRKKEGGKLVDRPADQMWWCAAGVQHPHCRGSWLPVSDTPPGVDPAFADWLRRTLEASRPAGMRSPG